MRAKIQVLEVTDDGRADHVSFTGVCGSSDKKSEDNTFAQYTPLLRLDMVIDNPALRGAIKPGAKFYLDFSPAQ